MWTSKLMVDGLWRGDVENTADIARKREAWSGGWRGQVDSAGRRGFPAERGRYHLFVSFACPFAHRVILVHALKGLAGIVGMSVAHPRWNTPQGWVLGDTPWSTPDLSGGGHTHLHQLYAQTAPDYCGRVTVPILWDCHSRTIVSDNSRDQMRMLGSTFDDLGADRTVDLVPLAHRQDIDSLNERIAENVAIRIYEIGGAETQREYDTAEVALHAAIQELDTRLSDGRPFLHGETLTESDILLFTPLVRFDAIYRPLFRALRVPLTSFCWLSRWLSRMLGSPLIAKTVKPDHIRMHYFDGWAPRNKALIPAWLRGT